MKTISIDTGSHISRILIGESLKNLKNYIPSGVKTVIITDENIVKNYQHDMPDLPIIVIGTGEKNKTVSTLEYIFGQFVELELDRSSFVIGIGGGIVCDVTGFAASVYMRGLRFGFVSTTLLSQVDASVGGKNGVNFQGYKNMLGVFNQPDFVICDPVMLKTLDDKEFRAGFSEIIKAGAIKDQNLFFALKNNKEALLNQEPDILTDVVFKSVQIKADVVKADEREKGERRKLNFGHTLAHSLEKLTGMLHGEAVSIGMNYAARISKNLGYLSENEVSEIRFLLKEFGLPVQSDISMQDIFMEMKKDKKREGEKIHFILLHSIGNAFIEPIPLKKLEEIVHDLR